MSESVSKADKTRSYIIERAAPVFNKKGYAGTSLRDITEVTGLTKGAIYGNFENKDEIAIAVYESSFAALGKRLEDLMNNAETASEKIIAFTDYYRLNWKSTFEKGGCPILNASIEADDNLPFLKKYVQSSIKRLASRLSKVIEEGQKKGQFKKSADATEYAYTFITLLEGGIMLGKIENGPRHLVSAMDRIIKIMKEELER